MGILNTTTEVEPMVFSLRASRVSPLAFLQQLLLAFFILEPSF